MAESLDQPGHPATILLVDDDPDLRAMYAGRLRADGLEVLLAADGTQALAAATRPIGLILLDLRMPGMDGLEVLRRLRDGATGAAVPVVMLSNESDSAVVAASRAMGAVDWWCKSGLKPTELSRRVRALLEGTHASFVD